MRLAGRAFLNCCFVCLLPFVCFILVFCCCCCCCCCCFCWGVVVGFCFVLFSLSLYGPFLICLFVLFWDFSSSSSSSFFFFFFEGVGAGVGRLCKGGVSSYNNRKQQNNNRSLERMGCLSATLGRGTTPKT